MNVLFPSQLLQLSFILIRKFGKVSNNFTLLIVLGLVLINGCASLPQTEPYFISDNYAPKENQKIVLLPAINLGMHENLNTELNRADLIENITTNRGYTFVDQTNVVIPPEVSKSTFDDNDFSWVGKVSLEPGVWVMVETVDYLNRMAWGTGARSDAYVSGYLVEYPSGKVLWENIGFGFAYGGFLLIATVDDGAVTQATTDVLRGLPPTKGKLQYSKSTVKKIKGACNEGDCSNTRTDPYICVVRDKTTGFVDEYDDNDDILEQEDTENYYRKRPVYNGTKLVAEDIRPGQQKCFSINLGKAHIRIDNGIPNYFKAKVGYKYNFFAKMNGDIWVVEEVPANDWEKLLSTQKIQ